MQKDSDRGFSPVSTLVTRRDLFRWTSAGVIFLFLVAAVGIAQDGRPAAGPAQADPDPQAQATGHQERSSDQAKPEEKSGTPDDARKRQIADESTQLLTMAIALKAEVDKTNKDMLSLNVIRKADQIEKLAHTVKEKIKQSGGPG